MSEDFSVLAAELERCFGADKVLPGRTQLREMNRCAGVGAGREGVPRGLDGGCVGEGPGETSLQGCTAGLLCGGAGSAVVASWEGLGSA
jgi:hypothetical protein